MRKSKLAFFISVFFVGCAHDSLRPEAPKTEALFSIGAAKLRIRNAGSPLTPGVFLIAEGESDDRRRKTLLAVDTEGHELFRRIVESPQRDVSILDLRKLDHDRYGYFACVPGPVFCGRPSYHVLDAQGRDSRLFATPTEDQDLNLHDFARSNRGTTFFIFTKVDDEDVIRWNEIREWAPDGRVLFKWAPDDIKGPYFINSIDIASERRLLIGISSRSLLLEVAYPSGKIESRISAPEWAFPGDPLGGFKHQQLAKALSDDRLLVLDNGDGRPSRVVEYRLDRKMKTATLTWEYRLANDPEPSRPNGGSLQRLSNGNTFIAWGLPKHPANGRDLIVTTELDPEGRVVRELHGPFTAFRTQFSEESSTQFSGTEENVFFEGRGRATHPVLFQITERASGGLLVKGLRPHATDATKMNYTLMVLERGSDDGWTWTELPEGKPRAAKATLEGRRVTSFSLTYDKHENEKIIQAVDLRDPTRFKMNSSIKDKTGAVVFSNNVEAKRIDASAFNDRLKGLTLEPDDIHQRIKNDAKAQLTKAKSK